MDFWFHLTEKKVQAYLDQLATSGWRALERLRSSGVIKGVGAGINEMAMIPRFLELLDLDFFLVALPYTLLDQEVLDVEFPQCEERGVRVVIGAVFASGILATGPVEGSKYKYAPAEADVLEKTRKIEAVCSRHGTPLAAAALQFDDVWGAVQSMVHIDRTFVPDASRAASYDELYQKFKGLLAERGYL